MTRTEDAALTIVVAPPARPLVSAVVMPTAPTRYRAVSSRGRGIVAARPLLLVLGGPAPITDTELPPSTVTAKVLALNATDPRAAPTPKTTDLSRPRAAFATTTRERNTFTLALIL
jgi:hypothetical protein